MSELLASLSESHQQILQRLTAVEQSSGPASVVHESRSSKGLRSSSGKKRSRFHSPSSSSRLKHHSSLRTERSDENSFSDGKSSSHWKSSDSQSKKRPREECVVFDDNSSSFFTEKRGYYEPSDAGGQPTRESTESFSIPGEEGNEFEDDWEED